MQFTPNILVRTRLIQHRTTWFEHGAADVCQVFTNTLFKTRSIPYLHHLITGSPEVWRPHSSNVSHGNDFWTINDFMSGTGFAGKIAPVKVGRNHLPINSRGMFASLTIRHTSGRYGICRVLTSASLTSHKVYINVVSKETQRVVILIFIKVATLFRALENYSVAFLYIQRQQLNDDKQKVNIISFK